MSCVLLWWLTGWVGVAVQQPPLPPPPLWGWDNSGSLGFPKIWIGGSCNSPPPPPVDQHIPGPGICAAWCMACTCMLTSAPPQVCLNREQNNAYAWKTHPNINKAVCSPRCPALHPKSAMDLIFAPLWGRGRGEVGW